MLVWLGAMWAFVHQYALIGRRYETFFACVIAGFAVHYALPARLKKAAFLVVSAASGLALIPVSWVATLAAYGLCFHLAASIERRAVRDAATAALALLPILTRRLLEPGYPVPDDYWDYFGAFFMFRAFLYWKDHATEPRGVTDALSYFLMAPAFAFLVFPIVDYRAFRRTYMLRPQNVTARAGIESIARGLLQLLFFRLVITRFYAPPQQVAGPLDLLLFCFCSFCSLVKVTGGYHIAVGTLQLFGFALPRPSNNYFLSSSFLDYWNRSNIYWKNFMVKNVYLPVFFRLQSSGKQRAVLAGGALTFVLTWLLHGALRFWFVGQLQLTPVRGIFWFVMGAGAIFSLLGIHQEEDAAAFDRWRVVKVPLTFLALCLLWGFGSMPTVRDWLQLVARAL